MIHRRISIALALAIGVALVGAPQRASADERAVKKVNQKIRESMENYDLLDYEAAKNGLKEALSLAKKSGLADHEVAARAHLFMAIVEFSGFENQDGATSELAAAVAIDSGVKIPAAYRTPELAAALAEAVKGAKGRSKPAVAEPSDSGSSDTAVADQADEVECDSVQGMQHELVEEASAGASKGITVYVGRDIKSAGVSLFYRPPGDSEFTEAHLKKSGGCKYSGAIPGNAVRGEFVHYYVAAKNKSGKTLASRGSVGSPNIIDVTGGSSSSSSSGGGFDTENPLGAGGGSSDPDGGEIGGSVDVGPKRARFFVTLAAGSGGGYVSGTTERTENDVGCCFAPALFHIFPEIGYYLSKKMSVSAAMRFGFPIGANIEGHSRGAPAALLNLRYALREDGMGLGLSGSIGGGVIRNTIKLREPANNDPTMDTDLTATGPLLLGAGASYMSALGGPLRFIVGLNALVGVPVIKEFSCSGEGTERLCIRPNFGLQLDVNLGLMFAF